MKIICIGRNYLNHIKELKNKIPKEIFFFLKPETAIPIKGQPFFLPDFSKQIWPRHFFKFHLMLFLTKSAQDAWTWYGGRYQQKLA